jgi:hypothetical protein
VGDSGIAAPLISHWASIIARGVVVPGPTGSASESPGRRALRFLIWSAWVSRAAAEMRSGVTAPQVTRALASQQAGFPTNGEFEAYLHANGETVADAKLELRGTLAAAAVARAGLAGAPAVGQVEAVSYYRHHKDAFINDETRSFEIVNALPFRAARRLLQHDRQGRTFSGRVLHESLTHEHMLHAEPLKRAIERAIFKAKLNSPGGPVKLFTGYSIFVVRRITPRTLKPFAAVRAQVEAKLRRERRALALSQAAGRLVATSKANTSCDPAYVIDMCKQSAAAPNVEQPLAKAPAAAEVIAGASSAAQAG